MRVCISIVSWMEWEVVRLFLIFVCTNPCMGKMQETVTAFFLIFSVKCPLHYSAGTELERTWNEWQKRQLRKKGILGYIWPINCYQSSLKFSTRIDSINFYLNFRKCRLHRWKSSSLSPSACGHESPIWRSSHLKSWEKTLNYYLKSSKKISSSKLCHADSNSS